MSKAAERVWRSEFDQPVELLAAFHERSSAFRRLAPPWQAMKILEETGTVNGGRLLFRVGSPPAALKWEAEMEALPAEEGRGFIDTQLRGPFGYWRHRHRFLAAPEGNGAVLSDEVEYKLPLHPVSAPFGGWLARRELDRLFAFRHRRTADDLSRIAKVPGDLVGKRVIVSGSSGFIGSALTALLQVAGFKVERLVRRESSAEDEIAWDPETGEIDLERLERAYGIIHLAGANVAKGKWTEKRKRAILESRTKGTAGLVKAVLALKQQPEVFLSASATGYYGKHAPDVEVDETFSSADDFLALVAQQWEAAAAPLADSGIRHATMRIGVVVGAQGGMLSKLHRPFLMGLGGPVSHGRQMLGWIALDDVLNVFLEALCDDTYSGIYNLTAPRPVSNREFSDTLGKVLRRPAFIPLPAPIVKMRFGEMGEDLLLKGSAVIPGRLKEQGYQFMYPELEECLRLELGRL